LKHHKSPFKWRHFEPAVILLCVRWYYRYQLSYRDLEEMMSERGLAVDRYDRVEMGTGLRARNQQTDAPALEDEKLMRADPRRLPLATASVKEKILPHRRDGGGARDEERADQKAGREERSRAGEVRHKPVRRGRIGAAPFTTFLTGGSKHSV
jgi:hypothetical protein